MAKAWVDEHVLTEGMYAERDRLLEQMVAQKHAEKEPEGLELPDTQAADTQSFMGLPDTQI